MRKLLILLLFSSFIIFHLFPSYTYGTREVKRSSVSFQPTFRLHDEETALNLSQVYAIYSNVFILGRIDHSACVSFALRGPYKLTGWLVLISPWKPFRITSNNTNRPFIELDYDPRTMEQNPIANTDHPYVWDYDAENQIVFTKFLLTSTVTITVYYPNYIPEIEEFALGKLSCTTLESVNLWLSIYGNYTAPATIDWLARLTIKDSTGKLVQRVDREFKLEKGETMKLRYDFGTFKEETYKAVVDVIDPVTGDVLATDLLTFEVRTVPPPPPSALPAIPWATCILYPIVMAVIGVAAYLCYKRGRKAASHKEKSLGEITKKRRARLKRKQGKRRKR